MKRVKLYTKKQENKEILRTGQAYIVRFWVFKLLIKSERVIILKKDTQTLNGLTWNRKIKLSKKCI